MNLLQSALSTANLSNKRVFVRADLNVPINNDGSISNDHRLTALLPTLEIIKKKGGTIILATHLGRPKKPTPDLSTKLLVPWLEKHGYSVDFQSNLSDAAPVSLHPTSDIILLENLRFFAGEQTGDLDFAQQLALLTDYYVNDAFALLHRSDTSITLLPTLLKPDNRTIGLLIEQELMMLNKLLDSPEKPFVLMIGGCKVIDKIPLIEHMLDKVQTILLGPAIVFTFLHALGKPIGKSLVDENAVELCRAIMRHAKEKKVTLLFPLDYQVAKDTYYGALSYIETDTLPEWAVGVSIGPKTVQLFSNEIKKSHTFFYNGLMGDLHRPQTLHSIEKLFTVIQDSPGLRIIGGGDSVGAAQLLHESNCFSYLSTGGGATLAYLAKQSLPGLALFMRATR